MIRIFKDWNQNEPTENQTMEIGICVKHIVYFNLLEMYSLYVFFKFHFIRCEGIFFVEGKTCTKCTYMYTCMSIYCLEPNVM